MYNIETTDRLKAKKIAGSIVPAIATTTAAVAGMVSPLIGHSLCAGDAFFTLFSGDHRVDQSSEGGRT